MTDSLRSTQVCLFDAYGTLFDVHSAVAHLRDRMDEALKAEYRFGHRIVELGDFREGIRAAIIDKDKSPKWRHARPEDPTPAEVSAMLRPLGAAELKLN